MTLTKKQRIALEFLAVVGPAGTCVFRVMLVFHSLASKALAVRCGDEYRITRKGREALKEAQK